MHSLQPLFTGMRAHGPLLLASTTEQAAELLALVWGPRFDREHGRYLALSAAQNHPALDHALAQAAYVARFEMQLTHATRPSAGLAQLRQGGFDAAILDVMLPEMDGFALCRTIRKESDIPLIMLTARGDVMDRVVGLELGADDYLPKPFEPRELVARLQTVLRRRQPNGGSTAPAAQVTSDGRLHFEGLTVDATTRSVLCLGQPLELTSTEFDLLHLLAREPGKVFHRDDILNQLRGHDADLYTRAVDIVVSRLRKKLEPLEAIKTLRNAGYALALRARNPGSPDV